MSFRASANFILDLAEDVGRSLNRTYYWVEEADLIGYASVGAILACNKYDSSKGYDSNKRPWLFNQTKWFALDLMRKDKVILRNGSRNDPPKEFLFDNLESPSGESIHKDAMDFLGDEDESEKGIENREFVAVLLQSLNQEDRLLVCLCYGMGLTQKEIGCILGISDSAVCMRRKAALRKLRKVCDFLIKQPRFGGRRLK